MDLYKKKTLQFCSERLGRDRRHAETLKARETSRFKRLSMIRSINDSDLVTDEKPMDSAPVKKPPCSRLEQLNKWKSDREAKKMLELQKKKKPFYSGGGSKYSSLKNEGTMNSRRLMNQSTLRSNVSRFDKSKIEAPAPVASKIPVNPKQTLRIPGGSKLTPNAASTVVSQSTATLKNTKLASSSAARSTAMRNFKPVFVTSKQVVPKQPIKPAPKIAFNAPKPAPAIPRTMKTIPSIRRPQQIPVSNGIQKPKIARIPNKPTEKESSIPKKDTSAKVFTGIKNAKVSKEKVASSEKQPENEHKCSDTELAEPGLASISNLLCDVSVIKPTSSFAPDDYKFQSVSGLYSMFDVDLAGIEDVITKFNTRTSTPSKPVLRASSICTKYSKDSLLSKDSPQDRIDNPSEMMADEIKETFKAADKEDGKHFEAAEDSSLIDINNICDSTFNLSVKSDDKASKDELHNVFLNKNCNECSKIDAVDDSSCKTLDVKSVVSDLQNQNLDHAITDVESLIEEVPLVRLSDVHLSSQSHNDKLDDDKMSKESTKPGAVHEKSSEALIKEVPVQEPTISEECLISDLLNEELVHQTVNNELLRDKTTNENIPCDNLKNKIHEITANVKIMSSVSTNEMNETVNDEFDIKQETLELADIPDDDDGISKCSKKSIGPKRVSMFKHMSALNSIAEGNECSPIKSPTVKLLNDASEGCFTESRTHESIQNCEFVCAYRNLLEDDDLSPTVTTPRRSARLQKPCAKNINNADTLPFTPKIKSHYPNFTPRHSMKLRSRCSFGFSDLISFDSPQTQEMAAGSSDNKTNLTNDFEKLHLNGTDENMDPNSFSVDFENSPAKVVKSKKISLLYTPEKTRKSMRRSIRGDLIAFSPNTG